MPLSAHEKRNSTVNDYSNLIGSCNFLFCPALGCMHVRGEHYLTHKSNVRPPPEFFAELGSCTDQCLVCSGDYTKYILPVVAEGVLKFLGSDHFKDYIRESNPVTNANADSILESLSKDRNSEWRKDVFGLKSVKVYNIRAFFFQLVGSKMLGFEWSNNAKNINYVLHKDEGDIYQYKKMTSWSGFGFREARHGAKAKTYDELKDTTEFRNYFRN